MPFVFLILLLIAEAFAFSVWLDTGSLSRANGLAGLIPRYGPLAVRSAMVFAVLVPVLLLRRLRSLDLRAGASVNWSFAVVHSAALALLAVASDRLFHGESSPLIVLLWLLSGGASVASAMLAIHSVPSWLTIGKRLGPGISGLLLFSIAISAAGPVFWRAWDSLNYITFKIVAFILHPLIQDLIVDHASKTIASSAFSVRIAPECSGYEGMALTLAFGSLWLWLNRRDYRFPRATLLLPAGVALMFALNSLRIAALFLLGHLGAPEIAAGGFHSQAGWIAFLIVSIGLAAGSRKLPWFLRVSAVTPVESATRPDETTVALAPFTAVMAVSLLTGALTAGFDWLYPLRILAAVAVLWVYRREYKNLEWRVTMSAVLTGAAVFALWIGLESAAPSGSAPPLWWILVRALSATAVIPLVEELAFRHYLQRRIASESFVSVDGQRSTLVGLLGASLVFGLLHGSRWIAGTFAGLIFGLEYRRRGSIGAATVSHAVANALLAGYVVATGSWQLW